MASSSLLPRIVPSELEPIKRIWMAFPRCRKIWGSKFFPQVQADWANLLRTIAKYKPVNVLCDSNLVSLAKSLIRDDTKCPITFITSIPYDDIWMRDTCCIFRRDGKGGLECVKLNFNGWGNKQTSKKDHIVADKIADYLGLPLINTNIVGEGGAIIFDGQGTLISTLLSWFGSKRNPGKTKDQLEKELLNIYGGTKMIWCGGDKSKDITDNHIDGMLAFSDQAKLFLTWPLKSNGLKESEMALSQFKNITDANGRSFEITVLPEPKRVRSKESCMLTSYVNYLVLDTEAVISVQFGDEKTDNIVRQQLSKAFPGRTIEMLNLDYLYEGEGGIHCMTMNEPFP